MLNAKQLIEQLQDLDPETILYLINHDPESNAYWSYTVWSVSRDGYIENDYENQHPETTSILRELNGYD